MNYVETTERYSTLHELQSDMFHILNRFREAGKIMDAEISIDLLELTITIIKREEKNEN